MKKFDPFANEADVLEIGALTIENRLDHVALYGDLAITKDQQGLKLAQELKQLLDATVASLLASRLPEHIPVVKPEPTDNPFK